MEKDFNLEIRGVSICASPILEARGFPTRDIISNNVSTPEAKFKELLSVSTPVS